jgi:hypothetical protein
VAVLSCLTDLDPNSHFRNQNALGGNISSDLFQDANALEESLSQQDEDMPWREWSLLASDGDLAALIELTSEGKVRAGLHSLRRSTSEHYGSWTLGLIHRIHRLVEPQ